MYASFKFNKNALSTVSWLVFLGLFGQAHLLMAADRTVIGELWSQDN